MAATDLVVAGSLGLLVAITFVVYEVILLPLFEHTRERLTIAAVRRRIAGGSPVTLVIEGSLPSAFGLGDGISDRSSFAAVPRALKIAFKIALIVSLCTWESQLQTVKRAAPVELHFDATGSALDAADGNASVIAPLPIEGLRAGAVQTLVPFGKEAAIAERNYSVRHETSIDIQFSSECVLTTGKDEKKNRTVYFGVYRHDSAGLGNLFCLNGTEGRESEPIFSYNPDSRQVLHGNVSRLRLSNIVALDRLSALFAAEVNIATKGPLFGNHSGFIAVTFRTHLLKDVPWSMYGLLWHRRRGTVMRLSFPLMLRYTHLLCGARSAQIGGALQHNSTGPFWPGEWIRNGTSVTCPDGLTKHKYVELAQGVLQHISDVQDVGFRFSSSDTFKIGEPLDVMRAWLAETPYYMFRSKRLFTIDLREMIERDVFFFSASKKSPVSLHIGPTRNHVQMIIWSSALLLAVVILFLVYALLSCGIEVCSRSRTGILSECVTRGAVLSLLINEARMRGRFSAGSATEVTIGLTKIGHNEQQLGLLPKENYWLEDDTRLHA